MNRKAIIFFLKAPEKGRAKTRLARHIGNENTLSLYKMIIEDMLNVYEDYPADVHIFHTPVATGHSLKNFLKKGHYVYPQQGKELGERMYNAMIKIFSFGYEQVILTGSDIPEISAALVDQAFFELVSRDIVLGPSHDGGYFLIGANRNRIDESIFTGIEWSSPGVFEQTSAKIITSGKSYGVTEACNDIDDVQDLEDYYLRFRDARKDTHLISFLYDLYAQNKLTTV